MSDFEAIARTKGLYGALIQKLINFNEVVGSDDDHDGHKEEMERKIFFQILFNIVFVLFLGAFYMVWKKKEPEDE